LQILRNNPKINLFTYTIFQLLCGRNCFMLTVLSATVSCEKQMFE